MFSRVLARRQGRGEGMERGLPAGPVGGGFAVPPATPGLPQPSLGKQGSARAPVADYTGSAAWTRVSSEVLEHPLTAPAVRRAAAGRVWAPAGSAAPVRPGGRG